MTLDLLHTYKWLMVRSTVQGPQRHHKPESIDVIVPVHNINRIELVPSYARVSSLDNVSNIILNDGSHILTTSTIQDLLRELSNEPA